MNNVRLCAGTGAVAAQGTDMGVSGFHYLYGPVPSRRLGRSLGIDLVEFKTCTYDCLYCQLGRTTDKTVERKEYVPVTEVMDELNRKLAEENRPDYISLAGCGEPTLNSGIGRLIREIKHITDIPLAVLTNGSLLWMDEVQDALMPADLVLPSLDAGDARLFQYVNRPQRDIVFERMVDGITDFTRRFPGDVWLEVFLLASVSGIPCQVRKIASIAQRIGPARVQLNTVCRPPAEEYASALSPDRMLAMKTLFAGRVDVISKSARVAAEVNPSDGRDMDIKGLLSRRPCTSVDVANGLGMHLSEALKHLEMLIASGEVNTVTTGGSTFYVAAQAHSAPE